VQTYPETAYNAQAEGASRKFGKGRIFAGAAAIAIAVTVPDLSVGAMDSPLLRLEVREPVDVLKQPVWSPAVGAPAPVYAPVMAAEVAAPASVTLSNRTALINRERVLPLDFLEQGSERFDLAFAGVEMPSPVTMAVSRGLPKQPEGRINAISGAIRTRVIDVPQIADALRFAPRLTETPTEPRAAVRPQRQLTASSPVARSEVSNEETAVAAFTGTLGASGDVRNSLALAPRPPVRPPRTPEPAPDDTVRAVPIPTPQAAPGARDLQNELVIKTRLDARINGVITGKVDFRQLDGTIAIRLGSVVDMLRNRFGADELNRIRGAGGLDSFLTLAQLQAAGVPISYDPVYDEVAFGIDYKDAPQAVKVHVEQIGSPTFRSDAALIDQIPRQ
jgi:hypothetical protein